MSVSDSRVFAFVMALLFPATLLAAWIHPVEMQMRRDFASLELGSAATFAPSSGLAGGRMMAGLRAEIAGSALRVQYRRTYDEPVIVEMGKQRLVLRAIGARGALAGETPANSCTRVPLPTPMRWRFRVTGGGYNASGFLISAELYDPVSGTFSSTGALGNARSEPGSERPASRSAGYTSAPAITPATVPASASGWRMAR